MFNFTTQTVYNTIVSSTITAAGLKPAKGTNLIINSIAGVSPSVRVGNTRFDARLIESIYMKAATPESLASVTFDMEDIPFETNEKEAVARIILYIGLSMNSLDSVYANPFVYKGKPFYVEFKAFADDAEKTAKECAKIVRKFLLFETDEKLLDVVVNGSEVTICGTNGYQLIRKAVLQKYDSDGVTVDCCTSLGEFVDIKVGVPVCYTVTNGVVTLENKKMVEDGTKEALADNEVAIAPGLEAFGDYNWIIHNLRLPTSYNTSFWAANKNEMPVAGQTYTLFTITMKDTRDRVAGESVGMRTTSVTTHVLYVATPYAATVLAALANLHAITTVN